MKIRKISTIIAIASLVGVIGTASTVRYNNKIMLSNRNTEYGCVINGDNQLVIKNKIGQVEGYVSVGQMLEFTSIGKGETFVEVETTGAKGYLDNSNILSINSGINKIFEKVYKDGKVINVTSKVNLRNSPSMQGKIINKLSNGINLKIIGKQGQWYKVEVNNQVGYIFGEYIGMTNGIKNLSSASSEEVSNSRVSSAKKQNVKKNIVKDSVIENTSTPYKVVNIEPKKESKPTSKVVNIEPKKESKPTSKVVNIEPKKESKPTSKVVNIEPKKESKPTSKVVNIEPKKESKPTSKVVNIEPKKESKPTSKVVNVGPKKESKPASKVVNIKPEKHTSVGLKELPNIPLQEWNTGFNTVENKMSAFVGENNCIMNIYTPKNPAGYEGGTVYVQFAGSKKIWSGKLISLITNQGGTNSAYGYFYEIPLYYKNIYQGTLYYGTNTYGYIQNGGFLPAGEKTPMQITLKANYSTLSSEGSTESNYNGFQFGCYYIDGVAQKGFQSIGCTVYYFGKNGQAYQGTHIIDGKKYVFSEEGKLVSGTIPTREYNELPRNIKLKSYHTVGLIIENMMHAKLANGTMLNIYIPQNPNGWVYEKMYSYVKVGKENGEIIGQEINIEWESLESKPVISTKVMVNGKVVGSLTFNKNVSGGVQALYKDIKTDKAQTIIFKEGYKDL